MLRTKKRLRRSRHNSRSQVTRRHRVEFLETRELLAGDLVSCDHLPEPEADQQLYAEVLFTSAGAFDPLSQEVEDVSIDGVQDPAASEASGEEFAIDDAADPGAANENPAEDLIVDGVQDPEEPGASGEEFAIDGAADPGDATENPSEDSIVDGVRDPEEPGASGEEFAIDDAADPGDESENSAEDSVVAGVQDPEEPAASGEEFAIDGGADPGDANENSADDLIVDGVQDLEEPSTLGEEFASDGTPELELSATEATDLAIESISQELDAATVEIAEILVSESNQATDQVHEDGTAEGQTARRSGVRSRVRWLARFSR